MENEFQFRSLEAGKKVIISQKSNKLHQANIIFNGNTIMKNSNQKIGNASGTKRDSEKHIKRIFIKTSKS